MENLDILILPGKETPLGSSSPGEDEINFAFFSSQAELAELLLFHPNNPSPFLTVSLSPIKNKTGDIWHVLLQNIKGPFSYTYKTFQNSQWSQELIDPYAKALSSPNTWNKRTLYEPKARYLPPQTFDWQGVEKPKTPFKDWIIYEMHIRGFSNHSSSGSEIRGTFLGVIEKIQYFKDLGINAIELLPIFEFDECENLNKDPSTGELLCNFWGYSTVNFFCPMQRYAAGKEWDSPILEFKTLIRELHKNGISVILDVVYNHTFEKGTIGPELSFKGFDKKAYYILDPEGEYYNFSGTGNTMNCNHPSTTKLIIDSLSYWASEMQVDAFRFDLASIFTRGLDGKPLKNPPILEAMDKAPDLQDTLFIAEAWDASGLYQVGSFPGKKKWAEWNGQYRDTVRDFIKGTPGKSGDFAKALCGSQNLYWEESPTRSINFVTAHDGYSLYDLVSYQSKHNLANGENNQDGTNDNHSWNCGIEGPLANPRIEALRKRQMKNFIVALMISLGIPMTLMGDEYAHSRNGNNNPYCQDTELNWFLWDQLMKEEKQLCFFQKMTLFRSVHKHLFCRESFFSSEDVTWHGTSPLSPDWSQESHFIAYTLKDPLSKQEYFICFNAQNQSVLTELPHLQKKRWAQIVDTSLESPYDFIEEEEKRPFCKRSYLLSPYSAFIAESR